MRSIVEEYDGKPELFLSHFGASVDDLYDKYDRLKMLLHERLKNNILNEYDHVHELFKAFLKQVKTHNEKTTQSTEDKGN